MQIKFPKKLIEKNLPAMLWSMKMVVRYCGFVFWVNSTTMEIYALSADSYDNGVIDGYKVGHVADDKKTAIKD